MDTITARLDAKAAAFSAETAAAFIKLKAASRQSERFEAIAPRANPETRRPRSAPSVRPRRALNLPHILGAARRYLQALPLAFRRLLSWRVLLLFGVRPLSAPVVIRTNTVAGRASDAIRRPKAFDTPHHCPLCDTATPGEIAACTCVDCPAREREAA